jgi:uncharacterized protein YndB with AHSA1/START domain
MARVEQSVEIAAPPEEVFLFFVPQRMPYWYGAEMSAEFEVTGGESDFRVAQKVRITGKLGRKEVGHTAVVTRLDPPRLLEWRFEDAYGVRGLERWELEPAAGGTQVNMVSKYEIPGRFGQFFDWLITRHAVARRNREYLERLRKFVERRGK